MVASVGALSRRRAASTGRVRLAMPEVPAVLPRAHGHIVASPRRSRTVRVAGTDSSLPADRPLLALSDLAARAQRTVAQSLECFLSGKLPQTSPRSARVSLRSLPDLTKALGDVWGSPDANVVVAPSSKATAASHYHLRIDVSAVFAAVLLNTRGITAGTPADVTVTIPSDAARLVQLARGGVLFALAQSERLGLHIGTRLASGSSELPFDPTRVTAEILSLWTRIWRPSDYRFRHRLTAKASVRRASELASAVSVVQDEFVTFINPHDASRTQVNAELTHNLAIPWLEAMLGPGSKDRLRPQFNDFATAIDEALDNILDHAFPRGYLDPHQRASLVQVFVTRTHAENASHRVHLLLLDNGCGIPRSLRSKLDKPGSDEDLLRDAMAGRVRHGRGRGRGLPGLVEIVQAHGGELRITTRSGDAALTASVSKTADVKIAPLALPVAGTVVLISLPVLAADGDEASGSSLESSQVQGQLPLAHGV